MKNISNSNNAMSKKIDPIPATFTSEEQAGEFWDAHSTADYEEYLEPVEMTIALQKRQYLITVDEESFKALFRYSKKVHKPVTRVASKILKEALETVH